MADTFGDRLKKAMKEKELEQKALAKLADLSESAVSRHVDRKEAPRLDSVRKYAEALGVSTNWLAYGAGEMVAAPAIAPTSSADPPTGRAALDSVLDDFPWPDGADIQQIDRLMAEVRAEAATEPGKLRPRSVWRIILQRRLREGSHRSGVAPRTASY